MFVLENVPLATYSTMRLGGPAAYLTDINTPSEIAEAIGWADERGLPVIMIGGGSNIIWPDEGFGGLVMVNKIPGFEAFEQDKDTMYVTVGAGEEWDTTVERCVNLGFSGIEQLSLIPGTAGATPIQNVGAYGREMSEVLLTVQAYDRQAGQMVTLRASECEFGYRTSRFKTTDKGRFFIANITMQLVSEHIKPPFYSSLGNYLVKNNITDYSPKSIREAVIAIRSSKLPDPAEVANNGSFFHNPIVEPGVLHQILADYPNMPYWQTDTENVKISAAWLVEQAGFKDVHDSETGMGTWPKQSLVLVNEHAEHTSQLLAFRQKIVDAVNAKFGIELTQEPELVTNSV